MKILFIIRDIEGVEPLGIMYIAALLKRAGHAVRFLPTRGVDLVAEVARLCPDGDWLRRLYRPAHLLSRSEPLPQAAARFPVGVRWAARDVLSGNDQEDGVNVVCRGEGEYAMLELCAPA